MRNDHDLYGRFASNDPSLVIALESADVAMSATLGRLLRHTPLRVLIRSRASLVAALLALPELHVALRGAWERQDAGTAATVFGWVEHAKLHNTRSQGHHAPISNWMQDVELAAA